MAFSKKKLKSRFEVGKDWEHRIAKRLQDAGFPAVVPTEGWIEGADVNQLTAEDQDVVVGEIVLEIKSRGGKTHYYGLEDFKFPTIIVDTVWGWKRKKIKPDYYLSVCQHTGGVIVIDGRDWETWSEEEFWDPYEQKRNLCFVADTATCHDWEWFLEDLAIQFRTRTGEEVE